MLLHSSHSSTFEPTLPVNSLLRYSGPIVTSDKTMYSSFQRCPFINQFINQSPKWDKQSCAWVYSNSSDTRIRTRVHAFALEHYFKCITPACQAPNIKILMLVLSSHLKELEKQESLPTKLTTRKDEEALTLHVNRNIKNGNSREHDLMPYNALKLRPTVSPLHR